MSNQVINALKADSIKQEQITNLNNGVILIQQGPSYTEIANLVELSLKNSEEKIRNDLNSSLEKVKIHLAEHIQNLKEEFFEYKKELAINLDDIGIIRTIYSIQHTYVDYPDDDLLNRLCDMLANSAATPKSQMTMLRIALFEAINTAKLITQEHLKVLAFIFLIRNCKFKSITCINSFIFFLKEVLWEFKPESLSNLTLPKHLEFSKCTTFVNREATIEKMLVNTYLPALQNDVVLDNHFTKENLFLSVVECLNLNAVPETSRLSNQFANNFNLKRHIEDNEEQKYRKKDYCSSRKGNESEKFGKLTIKLLNKLQDGEKLQIEWVESPIKNHVLTPVGMVLAISFIRQKLKLNIPYHKWIY